MSKSFRQHADEQLGHITLPDAVRDSVRRAMKPRARAAWGRRRALQAALASALLLGTLTAFALTRGFGLFELMGTVMPRFATVRPEAQELVRRDLARYSFEHVDVAILEAAYDGRYLRVAYSVTDRAATQPLDAPGADLMNGRPEGFDFAAASADGIWWTTLDWAEVNGTSVDPVGMTFSVAGPENGQAISWVQFDVRELRLPDTFTVRLPIRGSNTPRELDFVMDKGDMRHIFRLAPPQDRRIGRYVVHVREIVVSPIRTYITLHLIFDAGVTPEEIWEVTNRWNGSATLLSAADGSGSMEWTDTGAGPLDNMVIEDVSLPGGGIDFVDKILDPSKPVTMQVFPEFPPPRAYPDAFRLGCSAEDYILIPFVKAAY